MSEKRTVRSNTEANWKWACESEANFSAFVAEVRAAARRAGKAEGLREAAEILRAAAEADARNAAHCSAPNHRERLQKLSENEQVMAQRMLTRAEEVERG